MNAPPGLGAPIAPPNTGGAPCCCRFTPGRLNVNALLAGGCCCCGGCPNILPLAGLLLLLVPNAFTAIGGWPNAGGAAAVVWPKPIGVN